MEIKKLEQKIIKKNSNTEKERNESYFMFHDDSSDSSSTSETTGNSSIFIRWRCITFMFNVKILSNSQKNISQIQYMPPEFSAFFRMVV